VLIIVVAEPQSIRMLAIWLLPCSISCWVWFQHSLVICYLGICEGCRATI